MSTIQEAIEELEKIDLKSNDAIDKIQKIISTKLRNLPIFLTDLKVGEPLVRTRYLDEKEDYHKTVQDFSYNPVPAKINFGRANLPGQPIFYGSRFRVTALAEVRFVYANRMKDITRYSFGRWEVQNDQINLAAIVSPDHIRKHNAQELFELADYIEELAEANKNDKILSGMLGVYDYIADKYRVPVQEGEEYKYKLTAVFSNFIYEKLHQADEILYQSVPYPENFNVALKKEVVDAGKVKLSFAVQQKFERTGAMNYKEIGSIEAQKIDNASNTVIWP